MSRRLIQQDGATKLYRLGPGLFYLASVAREGLEIRKIALPFMERLRDITGENAVLHELRDGKRVCIEKVESKEVLRDSLRVGDQFPAHAGASAMSKSQPRCSPRRSTGRRPTGQAVARRRTKFRISRAPSGVCTTSGWNWTP